VLDAGDVAGYPVSVPALVLGDDGTAAASWVASKAVGGPRKWKVFGCGVPREVIAVSRLTIVMSASESTEVIDPNGHAAYTSGMTLCLAHAPTLRYGCADTMIEPCAT